MAYVNFLTAWVVGWTGVIGLQLAIYQIAISQQSKDIALGFIVSPVKRPLLGLYESVYSISEILFGRHLISRQAFLWSIGLSFSMFVISYGVAALTTPGQLDHDFGAFFLGDKLSWKFVAIQAATIIINFFGLLCDFIYFTKSRWLLRCILTDSPVYIVFPIFAADIITTFLLFSILTPTIVYLIGYFMAELLFHPLINSQFVGMGVDNIMYATFSNDSLAVYGKIFPHVINAIVAPLRDGFSSYHEINFGIVFTESIGLCSHPENLSRENIDFCAMNQNMYPDSTFDEIHEGFGFPYLLTTMTVSAFFTNIWMMMCAGILLASKTCYGYIKGTRSLFLYIHNHPGAIYTYAIAPSCLLAVLGAFIVPMLIPSVIPAGP